MISSSLQCFCNHHSDPLSLSLPIRTFVTGTTLETNFVFQSVFSSLCGSVFSFEIVKSKDKRKLSKIRKIGVFRILTSKLKASLRSQQLVGTLNTGGEKTPEMMFAVLPRKFHWPSVQWNARLFVFVFLINLVAATFLPQATAHLTSTPSPILVIIIQSIMEQLWNSNFALPWWSLYKLLLNNYECQISQMCRLCLSLLSEESILPRVYLQDKFWGEWKATCEINFCLKQPSGC